MKQFLDDIKGEWGQLKYYSVYRYSWKNNGKYLTRSLLIRLNRELSAILIHLLSNPFSLVLVVSAVALALLLPLAVARGDILQLLNMISGFIISFISVLVAAAIFVSTLHRQSSNRTAQEDTKFFESVTDNKDTLMKVYEKYSSSATDEQKIKLFKAVPCDSVLDQSDYENYKSWHLKNVSSLEGVKIESYDNFMKYPYNAATSVTWSRSYYMSEGCEVARLLLEKEDSDHKQLRDSVKALLVASKRNLASGSQGYYIPVEFVGQRLYRVIIYSLVALIFIFGSTVLSSYSLDIIPSLNMNILRLSTFFAISVTALSLYLILRYVFKFIAYLKDSTSYGMSGLANLYIYEPDVSMRDPNTPS